MGKIKLLKDSIKNLIWNYKIDNDQNYFINSLKSSGVTIGDNVLFVKPSSSSIDMTSPFLINIGSNVVISKGLSLFTHDYSSFILRSLTGEVLGSTGAVSIGSNVQIGANVTILMETVIDDYVIIAAGSVCKGHLETGFVYGGVPAKKISSIEDFASKRRSIQFEEAKNLAIGYYQKFNKIPDVSIFYPSQLFTCFLKVEDWPDSFWNGFGQRKCKNKIKDFYKDYKPQFNSYEDFLISIGILKR